MNLESIAGVVLFGVIFVVTNLLALHAHQGDSK